MEWRDHDGYSETQEMLMDTGMIFGVRSSHANLKGHFRSTPFLL